MSDLEVPARLEPREPGRPAPPQPRSTILVVLNDPRVHALLSDLLDDPHGRVVEVADIGTGLVLAQTLRPDCFVLDAGVPGLHRHVLLDQLRRDPRTRHLPLVVVGVDEVRPESVEHELGTGAADYIGPPTSAAVVAARVRGAMARAHLLRDLGDVRADFLAMLVHDLRTPLTVVQGYLDLLEARFERGAGSDAPARYLRNMQACCAQMGGLIGEILDLYKLDAEQIVGESRPVDLAALAAGVTGRFAQAATRGGVALALAGGERPLRVLGDGGRLDQVLMNLLGNALKFTPEGGTVTVTVRAVDGEIEVSVADSGPGIPAEEIPLLFERFAQAGQGRGARAAGTGLGLLICRRVIEGHGGRIWVESEPGRGTRAVFRLARMSDPAPGEAGWSEF